MHRQFCCDVLRGIGMAGQILQHFQDRLQPRRISAIALAQDHFRPRFGKITAKPKPVLRPETQPRKKLRQLPDVCLRVGTAHAQRMQLQNLAGQILVQPGLAAALERTFTARPH